MKALSLSNKFMEWDGKRISKGDRVELRICYENLGSGVCKNEIHTVKEAYSNKIKISWLDEWVYANGYSANFSVRLLRVL